MTFLSASAFVLVMLIIIWLVSFAWSTMTIGFTTTLKETSAGAGISETKSVEVTGDALISMTPVITGSTSNVEVSLAFVIANVKGLSFLCDKDITIEINDSGSPTDTITLTAEKPWVWYLGSGIALSDLITGTAGAVTKIFVNNPTPGNATLKIRGCHDATP